MFASLKQYATRNLSQFANELPSIGSQVVNTAVIETMKVNAEAILRSVVEKTPVLTGEARGGWHVSLNEPSGIDQGLIDPNGTPTVHRGLKILRNVQQVDRIYINNNVPYIGVLEEGGPNRVAHKMVERTLAEL